MRMYAFPRDQSIDANECTHTSSIYETHDWQLTSDIRVARNERLDSENVRARGWQGLDETSHLTHKHTPTYHLKTHKHLSYTWLSSSTWGRGPDLGYLLCDEHFLLMQHTTPTAARQLSPCAASPCLRKSYQPSQRRMLLLMLDMLVYREHCDTFQGKSIDRERKTILKTDFRRVTIVSEGNPTTENQHDRHNHMHCLSEGGNVSTLISSHIYPNVKVVIQSWWLLIDSANEDISQSHTRLIPLLIIQCWFFDNTCSNHGLQTVIISGRDSKFASIFWQYQWMLWNHIEHEFCVQSAIR